MAAVNLEDLLSPIRVEAPGCPRDLMLHYLREILREFCQLTRAYIHEDNDSILDAVSDYDIKLPAATPVEPIAIEYMTVDGDPCEFKEPSWLDANIINWRTRESDDFSVFTQLRPRVFNFPGVPTENGEVDGVYYRVSLKPTLDATEIDDILAQEWQEVWTDGTKAQLLAMATKPWFNATRATLLGTQYRQRLNRARLRSVRGYGNPNPTWVGPRFA